MLGVIWTIFKWVCYVALVVVVAGLASFWGVFAFGLCDQPDGTTVTCDAPVYRQIFEFGFTVLMLGVFTGVPSLLALVGLGLLVRKLFFKGKAE